MRRVINKKTQLTVSVIATKLKSRQGEFTGYLVRDPLTSRFEVLISQTVSGTRLAGVEVHVSLDVDRDSVTTTAFWVSDD